MRKLIPGGCWDLSRKVWAIAADTPRACKDNAGCELAGPAECDLVIDDKKGKYKCMTAVSAGQGKAINTASDRWTEKGCDKELSEPVSEEAVCKAGTCRVKR